MKKPTTLNKTLLILSSLALLAIKGFAVPVSYNGGTVHLVATPPSLPLNGSYSLTTNQTLNPFAVTGVFVSSGFTVHFTNGEFDGGTLSGAQNVDLADGQTVWCQGTTAVHFLNTGSGGAKQATPVSNTNFVYIDGLDTVTCLGGTQVNFWDDGILSGLTVASNSTLYYSYFNFGSTVNVKGSTAALFTSGHAFVKEATLNGTNALIVNEAFSHSISFKDNTVVTFGETLNMTDPGTTVQRGTIAGTSSSYYTAPYASPAQSWAAGFQGGTVIDFETSGGNVVAGYAKAGWTLNTASSTYSPGDGDFLEFSGGRLAKVNGSSVP